MAEALELTAAIVKALDAKRAMRIEVLHTTDVTTLADYFIMCSAASTTQLRTLSDACEEAAEKLGEVPHTLRASAPAAGCCWTTARSSSTCSCRSSGNFMTWNGCGWTLTRWTSHRS